ncbi:Ycf66 family protein [Tychonema sp. BBK16]|uniref:Ycf66 family protein n=1 Tax=Tychonema sp. BBK16 TaxID=2699888 RepID=UPI001F1A6F59|nr:Ycf66 family protein [Tychonema sp. BBK16]MCF6374572.1 hypothetical protein [Tychonema sp. BBK16]
MLAYFLALAVGLGSFSIYIAAFFFPEVHRKKDFAWSGVGLFYALILWACAGRITGALLLGQMAAVALLGWFAWETLSLRRQVTPIAQQTPIPQSVNLPGAVANPLAGFFAKKPEPASKKPKFVRSPKPKSDTVPAPVVDRNQVEAEISPVAEIVDKSAIAPELPIPDSITPTTEPIAVWSIANPVAETTVESAAINESAIEPKLAEIATAPTVEATETQPELKQELDDDDFDQMWRSAAKQSQSVAPTAAPTAVPTTAKVSKKTAGFGSLFGNIKNSLGGLLGRGSDKSKSPANTPANTEVTTAKEASELPSESIAPTSEISTIPTPDIEQILQSELAEAALEVATETSNTAVEENLGVPFPLDVEAMAELIGAETAISPTQLSEITVVEMVEPTPVEVEMSSDAIDSDTKQEVELIVVEIGAIASTEKPELIPPNPPTPNLAETDKPADESKSENVSGEEPTTP